MNNQDKTQLIDKVQRCIRAVSPMLLGRTLGPFECREAACLIAETSGQLDELIVGAIAFVTSENHNALRLSYTNSRGAKAIVDRTARTLVA